MAQEAINRSIMDTNSLTQSVSTTGIDTRQQQQQQQQQILHQQHFSNDTTANTSHPTAQTAGGLAAAVAAAAVANGPSSMVVGGTLGNAVSIGPVGSVLNQAVVLATPNTGQQQQQSLHDATSTALSNVVKQQQLRPTNEAHIPPLLGVAPLGPSPLHKDHQLQFQMMEAAYYHLPTPSDSEKLTTYFHRTPVQTPPHYPQVCC